MTQTSKQIVLDTFAAFRTRDPAAIATCFTEDAQWIYPHGNATAVAIGVDDGVMDRAGIVRFITEDFGRLFTDVSMDISGLYADGDRVIMEERFRARLPNGRDYDNAYCFVFELQDGKVRRMREYMDTLGGYRQVFGEATVTPQGALI
ncbi:nuclear transport factor 2 family protein [soil metagenome]